MCKTLLLALAILLNGERVGPRPVKNANPKSKLSAISRTWKPGNNHAWPMPTPQRKKKNKNHTLSHIHMSNEEKIYAGMEFENVCPGIMQYSGGSGRALVSCCERTRKI